MALESSFMKLDWARTHIDSLNIEIEQFLVENYKVVTDFTNSTLQEGWTLHDGTVFPDVHLFENRLVERTNPPLVRWALMTDDIVNNLRSSLDHMVFELAHFNNDFLTDSQIRRLQFPIYDEEEKFDGNVSSRLYGLPDEIKRYVKSLQMFDEPHSRLYELRDLSNSGKHHTLQIGAVFLDSYSFSNPRRSKNPNLVVTMGNVAGDGTKNVTTISNGMILSPISIFDLQGDRPEDYLIDIKFEIIFIEAPSVEKEVVGVLRDLEIQVGAILEFIRPYGV